MEEETVRRPDSTRRECLVPSSSSRPSRSRRASHQSHDEAVITWEDDDVEDAGLKEALRQSALEEAERVERERVEEALRQSALEEAERVERQVQKYGFVQSRLRLMEHPSDAIPTRLLERIRSETVQDREKSSSSPPPPPSPEEKEWVRKRAEKSPPFGVLLDLLEKK